MSSLTVFRPERSSQRAESQEKVKCQICQNSLCRHCNPVGRWAFQCSRIAWHTTVFHISIYFYYYILLWYLRLAIKRAWVAWGSTNACIRLAPCDKIRDVKYMHCTALQNHTYQNSAALRGICRQWLRRRVLQDHCTRTSRLGGSVGESSSQRPGSACEGPSLIRLNAY